MGIEVKINAADAGELKHILAGLSAALNPVTEPVNLQQEVETEAPKKLASRGKTKTASAHGATEAGGSGTTHPSGAASAPDPQVEPEAERPVVEYPAEPQTGVTYDDVKAAVNKLAVAMGREAVLIALQELGVDHCNKLTESQWSEAVELFTAKLEG